MVFLWEQQNSDLSPKQFLKGNCEPGEEDEQMDKLVGRQTEQEISDRFPTSLINYSERK